MDKLKFCIYLVDNVKSDVEIVEPCKYWKLIVWNGRKYISHILDCVTMFNFKNCINYYVERNHRHQQFAILQW